jgi:hypothetical protein
MSGRPKASQSVGAGGWPYLQLVSSLYENPESNLGGIATMILNRYGEKKYFICQWKTSNMTMMSVV